MSDLRICCNCVKRIDPGEHSVESVAYRKRMYCSKECSNAFRRRERNRVTHPPAVLAHLAQREVHDRPSKSSMQGVKVSATYSRYLDGTLAP